MMEYRTVSSSSESAGTRCPPEVLETFQTLPTAAPGRDFAQCDIATPLGSVGCSTSNALRSEPKIEPVFDAKTRLKVNG
jgi:hypothetical protein